VYRVPSCLTELQRAPYGINLKIFIIKFFVISYRTIPTACTEERDSSGDVLIGP
jgi:hypothetical protein